MSTAFKQLADNAVSTTTTDLTVTGVTTITAFTGDGSKFPTPGNGFYLTLWDGPDPGIDPNLEKVLVTNRSEDTLTVNPTTKTHASPTNIGLLDVSSNITDLQTAVNAAETNISILQSEVGGSTVVNTTANQSIGGIKTFTGEIIVPTPMNASDAVTKAYADTSSSLYYNVKAYGATGNGSTDDGSAIQAAINAATTAGGGVVFFPPGTYVFAAAILPGSNITMLGCGAASILKTTTNAGNIINWSQSSGSINDIVIDSLMFVGPVNQTVTIPQRSRTTSGNGASIAVYIDGSLDTTGAFGTVTNFTMRNCIVRNCTSLPIRIFGVTGKTIVTGCEFTNNMDVGFGYNQEVVCTYNHSYMSADNGFSISRNNIKVTCVGNTAELCCYDGIWLSGFVGYPGPTDFTCTGNAIRNPGRAGISLIDIPMYGNVSDNVIDMNYNRLSGNDISVCGIFVRGTPSNVPSSPTTQTKGLVIANNVVRNFARAGIYLNGCDGILVEGNLLIDGGTHYLSNNITTISSTDTTQNIGILLDYPGTISNVWLKNNVIYDTRTTPYCNYAIYPLTNPGMVIFGNTMLGCRNASNIFSTLPDNAQLNAGVAFHRTVVSDTNYSIMPTDYLIAYTSLTSGRTVTLPDVANVLSGSTFQIKDESGNAGSNTITVATTSSQTIDGASTKAITLSYGFFEVYSTGTQWMTRT